MMSLALLLGMALGASGLAHLNQNTLYAVQNTTRTCNTRDICENSGNCESFDLVRKSNFIDADNIKTPDEIPNFAEIKKRLQGKHLRIRSSMSWFGVGGFFTYPLYAMNQIILAESLGLIGDKKPFVYMPESHHYWDSCEDSKKEQSTWNFWDRWFKPVSDVDSESVAEADVWEFGQESIESIHHNKASVLSYPYQMNGHTMDGAAGTALWTNCQLARAKPIVDKYIDVQDHVKEDVKAFMSKTFPTESPVLGVHMRGTDKWITRKAGPEEYTDAIQRFSDASPSGMIYLATDDPDFLTSTKGSYGESLIVRDARREKDNVLYNDKVDKDSKSNDVMMASMLLSKTDTIIRSWSGVSEFSVYMHMKEKPDTNMVVVNLQLNTDSSADKTSLCTTEGKIPVSMYSNMKDAMKGTKPTVLISDTKPIVLLSENDGGDGGAKMDVESEFQAHHHTVYHRDHDCSMEAPRIHSQGAYGEILKSGACSRDCVAFRSRHGGAKFDANMKGNKTMVLVVAHWKEDLEWLKEQPLCYIVMEKVGNTYDRGEDPSFVAVNKGNEASSYLKFIKDNYGDLPDSLVTTHGDRASEHSVDMVAMLRTINPDAYPYASLNGIVFPMVDSDDYCDIYTFYHNEIPDKSIFPEFPRDFMGFSMACCAQFIVSKEQMLKRPLSLYQSLYDFAVGSLDSGHKHGETVVDGQSSWTGYNLVNIDSGEIERQLKTPENSCPARDTTALSSFDRGEALELTWHVIFGMPWKSPKVDSNKLCGDASRCPQNLPIIRTTKSKNKNTLGVVENPKDPFWYPANEFAWAVQDQPAHHLGSNFLISTPVNRHLGLMEQNTMLSSPLAAPKHKVTPEAGVYDLRVPAMDNPPVAWFGDLLANKTVQQPEFINVLLYNDDPCGVDLFGLRAEPFVRFDGCGTPMRLYSSRHRGLLDDMDVVIVSQGWSEREEPFNTPFHGDKREGQVWASCSVENGVTYPRDTPEAMQKKFAIDTEISSSPKASIPMTFYSHFYLGDSIKSDLRSIEPMSFSSKIPKIAIMQAACKRDAFDYRTTWIENLMNKTNSWSGADSIGRCWHNAEPRVPWENNGMGLRPMAFHQNKMANIRPYMFTLCHESVNLDHWVTEKVYHALAVGSVPVFRGSKKIQDYLPCKNCIIDASDFKSDLELSQYLEKLSKDEEAYSKLLAWKNEPYDPKNYPEFEKVRSQSIDTALCRVANKAPSNEFRHKAKGVCEGECLEEMYKLHRVAAHG